MKKITPESSWMIGDYLHGYTVEHIANLYSVPLGTVEAVIAQGITRRRSLKKQTRPYQPPKRKSAQPKHTHWLGLENLADRMRMKAEVLLELVGTPEGDVIGLEEQELPAHRGGGYRYRVFTEHVFPSRDKCSKVTPTIFFKNHDIRVVDGMYCLTDFCAACGLKCSSFRYQVSKIDPQHKAKFYSRHEGSQGGTTWFVSIEGAIVWAMGLRGSKREKAMGTVRTLIDQEITDTSQKQEFKRFIREQGGWL